MRRKTTRISAAARELKRLLEEQSEIAESVREHVDRARLSRYCRGLTRPAAATLGLLDRLTDGRVAASDWGQP
jgi:hypothetical protein